MNDNIAKLGFEIDTSPLSRAAGEAQKAAQQVGQLGVAADRAAQQTKGATQSAGGLSDALGRVNGTIKLSTQELQNLAATLGTGGLGGSLGFAIASVSRFATSLGPIGAAVGGVAGLSAAFVGLSVPLARAADAAALLEGRMRNALGSTEAAQASMKALFEQTQQTGLGFSSAADAFLRVARNAESLGATREQMLQLTDTVQKLGKASGASSFEVQGGLVQLGQALAAGRLNGDELRSIMENMPALAKAIADGLGVSVGQIRALGAAGELTSDKVFNAILKASQKANEEFAKLPDTVEQANRRVSDNFDLLLSNLGQKFGSSQFLRDLANLGNRVVGGLAAATAPPNLQQQLAAAEKALQVARLGESVDTPVGPVFMEATPKRLAELQAEIDRLRAQIAKEAQEAADKERDRLQAPFRKAVEDAANEFDKGAKELRSAIELRDRIRAQIANIQNTPITERTGEQERALPNFQRQLLQAEENVLKLASGLDKARTSATNFRDALRIGGGGGGVQIVQQAQEQARAARAAGQPGSVQQFIALGVEDAAARAQQQIAALERQSAAQDKLAGATGRSRDAIRDLEIAQEVANFRFQTFGTLTGPAVERTVAAYEASLRRTKVAQDALGDAQAFQSVRDNLAAIAAQMAAVERGAYAMRRAAVEARAEVAERSRPGAGAGVLADFDRQEALSGAQRLADMRRQNARLGADADLIGDPAARRRLTIDRAIEDAGRDLRPEDRDESASLIRQRFEREAANELKEQNAEIRQQLAMTKERVSLIGLTGERLMVETALLEKRNQLQRQGVDLSGQQAQDILASTEALARQQFQIQKAQEEAQRYQRIWDNAARNIQEGVAQAFEEAFRRGEFSMKAFFDLFSNIALRVASNIITAQIVDPLTKVFTEFAGSFVKGLFSGGGAAKGAAYGDAFSGGNVIPFARGGVVSRPTVFGMASGGMGVAGEAGPEAVLPLRRGNDGRLGVASGGGGNVTVIVNDQRTVAESKPVEISQSRSPDGQRLIQVLVRDEVRRAIRAGDVDRDMQNSYGAQRRLVTR